MRVLLRGRQTRLYYIGRNQSGVEHERALDFGNVRSATKFTFDVKLPDMEIILRYDSCDAEIGLPVLPEWCLLDERALGPATDPTAPGASLSTSTSRLS